MFLTSPLDDFCFSHQPITWVYLEKTNLNHRSSIYQCPINCGKHEGSPEYRPGGISVLRIKMVEIVMEQDKCIRKGCPVGRGSK